VTDSADAMQADEDAFARVEGALRVRWSGWSEGPP
jgi:hypothetical protein